MRYAIAFSMLTISLLAGVGRLNAPWGRAMLVACAAAAAGLALAYALRNPRLLGKRADGSLAPLAWLVFWPYFLLNLASLWSFRILSREEPASEIVPGLYLGSRPLRRDRASFETRSIAATLDLTAEFSEAGFARAVPYLCLPLLDTFPPARGELANVADWIGQRLAEGPVLVHCALGHGRSACAVAAHLLRAGHAATVDDAIALVSERRPGVRLEAGQMRALKDYAASLGTFDR